MLITFDAELIDKGGAKEPRCHKLSLVTQELDDTTLSCMPLMHGKVVKITIDFE